MPLITLDTLRAQAKSGELLPLYLIVGDDEHAKDEAVDVLQSALPEDLRPFNAERVSALETSPDDVVASARTLPLLGDRRLVVVTRAERWLVGRRRARDGAGDDDDDAAEPAEPSGQMAGFEAYVERPEPLTTVVLVAADANRTLRLVKAVVKQAGVLECWGLKGEKEVRGGAVGDALARAAAYVTNELRSANLTIDRRAVQPLLEHAGTDIGTLRGDVERLALYCAGQQVVRVEDVQAVVLGATLVNRWGVVNAVERGDTRDALRQLALALDAGEVPYMVLGQLAWFVRTRLPTSAPTRVAAAVEAVFQADLALKSSGGEPRILLERLVVELTLPSSSTAQAPGRGSSSRPVRPG